MEAAVFPKTLIDI